MLVDLAIALILDGLQAGDPILQSDRSQAVTDSRPVDRLVVEAALASGFGVRLGASSVTGLPGGSAPVNEQPGQVRVGDDLRSLRKDLVHERVLDLRDRVSAGVADDDKAIVAVCCVADR